MTVRRSHSLIGLLLAVTSLQAQAGATVDYPSECLLPCRNGGVCLQHRPGTAVVNVTEDELPKPHPYCHCPTGFIGAFCEVQFVVCANPAETCSNGAACTRAVDLDEEEFHHCECNATSSDLSNPTNQAICQRASTVFCVKELVHFDPNATVTVNRTDHDDKERADSGAPTDIIDSVSFCVNGGTCKEMVESGANHAGCNCVDPWAGPHCEHSTIPVDESNIRQQVEFRRFRMTVAAISATVALSMFGALAYFAYEGSDWAHEARRRQRRRRRLRARRQRQRQQQQEAPEQEMVAQSRQQQDDDDEEDGGDGERSGEESGTSGKTTESTTTASYR